MKIYCQYIYARLHTSKCHKENAVDNGLYFWPSIRYGNKRQQYVSSDPRIFKVNVAAADCNPTIRVNRIIHSVLLTRSRLAGNYPLAGRLMRLIPSHNNALDKNPYLTFSRPVAEVNSFRVNCYTNFIYMRVLVVCGIFTEIKSYLGNNNNTNVNVRFDFD